MKTFLVYFLASTALALVAGLGFGLAYDSSPKYDQVELTEYEKCLDNRSDIRVSSAESLRNPDIAGYEYVLTDCQAFKPKPIN